MARDVQAIRNCPYCDTSVAPERLQDGRILRCDCCSRMWRPEPKPKPEVRSDITGRDIGVDLGD